MERVSHLILAWLLLLTVGRFVLRLSQKSSQTSTQQIFKSRDGISQFTYPSSYTLFRGDETGQAARLSYIPVCQSAIACVVYPRARYAGTNFEAASFQEREIRDAITESACLKSPMRAANFPEFDIATKDPTRIINGVSFLHGISDGVGLGHSININLYRAFHDKKCYELSINVAITQFANFDPGTVTEFTSRDAQNVQNELTMILDSFRFLK